MKILFGILIGVGTVFAIIYLHSHIVVGGALAKPATIIPSTLEGFYTAVGNGQITFKLTDPLGIYDASGSKIGYWTADGSVYDMANNLVAKGFNGIKKK